MIMGLFNLFMESEDKLVTDIPPILEFAERHPGLNSL